MATSVAAAAGAPGAPTPPTRQDHQSGGGLLLVLLGLGAAGGAAWLLLHRKSSPTPTPTPTPSNFAHYKAGSGNPSLVTPQGVGLPNPGEIPCYGLVAPYPNQGVMTTIGQGPAGFIPWGQDLAQTGDVVSATWPAHPNIAGIGYWIPTDYRSCLASLADVTPI